MEKTKYTTRYVSRITLEAETPLSVGTGKGDLLTDSVVATDVNGMPYIPGTSLAGVIRSVCDISRNDNTPFGFQQEKKGEGSRVIFSDAVMIGKDGTSLDGLRVIDFNDTFYAHFKTLPIRQHVRIGEKGTAEQGGKFDEQVVYKGTRFCFEIELLSTGSSEEEDFYNKILSTIGYDTFRVGSGTRNGLGLMKAISVMRRDYDLTNASDLKDYATRSASLDRELKGAKTITIAETYDEGWKHYVLHLRPSDFFLFSSGMGDEDADITPVKESFIEWTGGKPQFKEQAVLIPASSVKGAIAHRTAYHWNKLTGRFADSNGDKPLTGDSNPAIASIFGKAGKDSNEIERGNIMLSDVFIPDTNDKILNHVAIDRFTGGSMDGALFTEKVTDGHGLSVTLNIDVLSTSIEDDIIQKAFERTLKDIAEGLLPLGGGVNRGNGTFEGTLECGGKQL